MFQLLLGVMAVLVASATCSLVEAALFSVPLTKVRQLAETKQPAALALLTIRENMNRPIATIVIVNNISNIVGSITLGAIAGTVLGSQWLGLFSTIFTFLVIILAEITPKVAGERFSEPIALFSARPIRFLVWTFTPLVWAVEKITSPITEGASRPTTDEAEIKLLAKIGQQEGIIESDESQMIQQVFKLNDITASNLMTPRVTLTHLQGRMTLAEAKDEILASPHSRIIVIGDTIDDVLGIVLKGVLLTEMIEGRDKQRIAELVSEVRFVPETLPADKLLPIFQQRRQHLAVVVDEFGGIAGVVTLEDVVEVLTGDIVDETDLIVDLQASARRKARKFTKSDEIQFTSG
ncbi:hemolysin family protein [Anaerolineales bacterium HSG6]|nr:hemolysin family protein [Anaerolineales bacterium HSG6]MDM8530307.1 hemolysin family protein [Anaerolineales bacterium HSG25]